jgi:hypothetical protein
LELFIRRRRFYYRAMVKRLERWFALTREERLLVLSIIAIALIGTVARAWHLKHRTAQPYHPPGLEQEAP